MRKFSIFFIAFFFSIISIAQVSVKNLLSEYQPNPIGLDVPQPRFGWQLQSSQRSVQQSAYELIVSAAANPSSGKNVIWKSGKVNSSQSVHIKYAGAALQSSKKYFWQVRVWDNAGKASPWSEVANFEMALLNESDWKAKWIAPGYTEDSVLRPSPMFRKQFSANKKIQSARAYITSHGIFEAFINGKRIGDAMLTPGWTSYNKRLQYLTFDVTSLLKQGDNAIGASLGSGWFRGYLAWQENKNIYGKELGVLLQLQITYTDGSTQTVISDESWKSTTGAVRYSEIYNGEINDARMEKSGWTNTGYNDADWSGVSVKDWPKKHLLAMYNEPVRKREIFKALKIIKTPQGDNVIDFGQNLTGLVEVTATGKAGDSVKIYHAEVLDKAGNFYVENLRAAKQLNVYILKGNGAEKFEPHFTFQGFRYIKVEGVADLKLENFVAVAMYSDMKTTGEFTSSHKLINQLQHNIEWGQRGNFLDVPTDCPQRDERLGWTGDAQAFSRTAAFNMHVHNFFAKWLRDVEADQDENGSVPFVVPNVLGKNSGGSAGWADAATIIPWNMYLAYGDTAILQTQYNSMKNWVEFMRKSAGSSLLWNKGFHFGDWLFYRPFDDNDGRSAITDKYLIAQCFFAHSTQLLVNAAKVLGKSEDAYSYSGLLAQIKDAFMKEYMTSNGRLVSSTQTAYVLALNFDMLPENLRKQSAERLAQNVKDYGNHLTTGFLGTPYLCHVLSRFGYTDVAFTLLMQENYPSWLYPVKMGATTIWERWDGQKPDGTFQTPGMNSFNHYAYGAIGDWMYRVVAGLDTEDSGPGYKKIVIKPHVGGGLTNASATLQTYYGTVSSGWKKEGNQLVWEVEIPSNTTATLYIPAKSAESVKENNGALAAASGIKVQGTEGDYVKVEAGSGKYRFVVE